MPSAKVYGVDRFGQVALGEVEFFSEPKAPAIYVGTKATVGVFGSNTSIITAAGRSVKAASLASELTVTDHSFEAMLRLSEMDCELLNQGFWLSLCEVALASDGQVVLLSKQNVDGKLIKVAKTEIRVGTDFWADVTTSLERRRKDGADAVFERGEHPLLIWYLSALVELGVSYSLAYDSIQHTASVGVILNATSHPRDLRGACAFHSAFDLPMVRMAWGDASWSPVVDGFLVRASH
ncbi:hypothetical protein [Mesorhizobium onobrychidis]|uniref:Uncharacterized protein n=1 Tax=Mesorhizobium onobrychidis TaxID=2775404 RepID=A0ABY5QY55_9HYPH|nr:hypothetical protein [Mesorhizobium onobrychidis]UVC16135.1 hypothetical protein IHQ72_02820 [Mesorhizobium onobrychidis]